MAEPPSGKAEGSGEPDVSAVKPAVASLDDLRTLLDQCTSAHAKAEAFGEKFLSYLLAMAIEEVRTAIQRLAPRTEGAD